MKRCFVLFIAVLITAVFPAAGCGGGASPTSITGIYVYREAPSGQAPTYDFRSDGTVVITVPANVNWKNDPQPEERKVTWYYKTGLEGGTDIAELWEEKKAMTSDDPDRSFTIYKDGIVDTQGRALVKEGAAPTEPPSSSVPSVPASTP